MCLVACLVCLPACLLTSLCLHDKVTCLLALQLLTALVRKGFLLDELSPSAPRAHSVDSASWMGLCRIPPGGPARRIDCKVGVCVWRWGACCSGGLV